LASLKADQKTNAKNEDGVCLSIIDQINARDRVDSEEMLLAA